MPDLGHAALLTAFVIAAYTAVASFVSARGRVGELWLSARNGVYAAFGLTTIASGVLLYDLLTHDFTIKYVAEYTSRSQSPLYNFAAWWAGLEGSLLFWAWLLSLFAVIVLIQSRRNNRELIPYISAVNMALLAYFLGMMGFALNPFETLPVAPADGMGLNPLLDNPGMLFHPTTLYLGYVGFTIPFAFAIAALISGRLGTDWIRASRRWTLFAWFALGLGNLFGAQWAYTVLGWGGYWGWDPVENASFMPWLVGTAYLHSVMIQERRGMLKVWNILLIIIAFSLSLFGTMVTRSGILSSVHSFSSGAAGPLFLALLTAVAAGSLGLLWLRLPALRSENQLDSLVSRESSFLLNNLLLVGAAFAIFWGSVFPILSEAVRGVKTTVGPPFFQQVTGPIFLALLLLMGICPLIGWRKASPENLARNFLFPLGTGVATAVLLLAFGMRPIFAALAFAVLAFVAASVLLEFYRGVRARHRGRGESYAIAVPRLIWANKPRYGGYIVHVGVILIALGVVGSQMFATNIEATVKPGETIQIRDYVLTYQGLTSYTEGNREIVAATLDVRRGGESLGSIITSKSFSAGREEPRTDVSIRSDPREDLYTILSGWNEDGTATFKVLVNPLVMWIWVGGAVLLLGTAIAFWPDARAEARLPVTERMPAKGMRPSHA
jgi:cytochrome c-type biogenesis protein CcmF